MADTPETCPDRHAGCARNVAALLGAMDSLEKLIEELRVARAKPPKKPSGASRRESR